MNMLQSNSIIQRDDYDIFISYSRRNKEFVSGLCKALIEANLKIWVDWNDIPPAEDWRQEIYRGIEASNNFVFIISSHSIASKVCAEELSHAIKHGKRLIPIVREDVGYDHVHPELGRINWIFFREGDDFDSGLEKLISAIETDMSYVRQQTHLLVRARQWEKAQRNKSYLLQGSELRKAEQWLAEAVETCHGTSLHHGTPIHATSLHREYINTSRRLEREREDAEMRLRRLTPQQFKNRQAILNKVRKFWVEGVLEKSLHDQMLIVLDLEQHPDAVVSSWSIEVETAGAAKKTLPKGTKVVAIFDQLGAGKTLLILGEPGAGKTTTLLELTCDLLYRAEQGLDYRIPVVLNLSSWAAKQQTIPDWVVEQLNSKYQVPTSIGKEWMKQQELLLLLDGLDEVKAQQRDNCVAALNDFHQNYVSEMVVCSCIQDYSDLSNRLNLESAIYLRALTLEQVSNYLGSIDANLTGLRTLMETDTALQELARSSLMLNIMVIAYEGVAVADLPKTEVVEERRKQLFDAYIERMFHRPTRFKVEQQYSEVQTKCWLTWLAQRLVEQSQTVFFIEGIQPSWLQGKDKRILYRIGSFLISWSISGLSFGIIFGSISGMIFGLNIGLTSGLIFILIYGLSCIIQDSYIATKTILENLYRIICTFFPRDFLAINIVYTLNLDIDYGTRSPGTRGLIIGLISGLTYGLIVGLTYGSIVGLTYGLIIGLTSGLIVGLTYGLIIGLIIVLCAAIVIAGKACIRHLTLRLILYRNGYIPWNYAHFLDYASDRIFLQKVGGGYIFIHRLLLEHFAQRSLEPLGRR